MLQNASVAAFTVSELLSKNQQEGGKITAPLLATFRFLEFFVYAVLFCDRKIILRKSYIFGLSSPLKD